MPPRTHSVRTTGAVDARPRPARPRRPPAGCGRPARRSSARSGYVVAAPVARWPPPSWRSSKPCPGTKREGVRVQRAEPHLRTGQVGHHGERPVALRLDGADQLDRSSVIVGRTVREVDPEDRRARRHEPADELRRVRRGTQRADELRPRGHAAPSSPISARTAAATSRAPSSTVSRPEHRLGERRRHLAAELELRLLDPLLGDLVGQLERRPSRRTRSSTRAAPPAPTGIRRRPWRPNGRRRHRARGHAAPPPSRDTPGS